MKFSEFKYERPDVEQAKKALEKEIALINSGHDLETEIKAIDNLFAIFDNLNTMGTLVSIRNSVDTTDEFYEKEQEFFDEQRPVLQQFEQELFMRALQSKNRAGLEEKYGKLIFLRGELAQKTFKPEII